MHRETLGVFVHRNFESDPLGRGQSEHANVIVPEDRVLATARATQCATGADVAVSITGVGDAPRGFANLRRTAAVVIQSRQQIACNLNRLRTLEVGNTFGVRDAKKPRAVNLRGDDFQTRDMTETQRLQRALGCANVRQNAVVRDARFGLLERVEQSAAYAATAGDCRHDAHHGRDRANRHRCAGGQHGAGKGPCAAEPTPTHTGAVAPGGELRAEWFADAHQVEPMRQRRQPDIVGRHADDRRAVQPLTCFNRFPSFLERGEVPVAAFPADHPQSATCCIEGESASDLERLDLDILPEMGMTEQTRGIHEILQDRQGFALQCAMLQCALPVRSA